VNGTHIIIKPEDFRLLYGLRNFGLCLSKESDDDSDEEEPDDIEVEPNTFYFETLADKTVAGKSGRFIGKMILILSICLLSNIIWILTGLRLFFITC